LKKLIQETNADAIYWNRRYSPFHIQQDSDCKIALLGKGMEVKEYPGNLLIEPSELLNKQGNPFKVFTPFYKTAVTYLDVQKPLPTPSELLFYNGQLDSTALKELKLLPTTAWAEKFIDYWTPGELGAHQKMNRFCNEAIQNYDKARDIPATQGTSRLSPHLHFGEISPRQVYEKTRSQEAYVRELYFREFAYYLLFHFPKMVKEPLRPEFMKFPWNHNESHLHSWQKGLTGYPIVDAGMRELWQTGWMHNRVRMIVGSFLVKHLLLPWQEGARWFQDTLLDADLANNIFGWQWVAGCGADAAPYFRIFNPILQGEKFDPQGEYVKKYVPELKQLPTKYIHKPWKMDESELKALGVTLGETYPYPIVDHADARAQALDAFQQMRE
ncbi:MAG: deoxyribodipyrimidine photolyase, partial [Chlamydiia bacterium]|nr:deoxyribodipyrimidine photolyase [Chlamydiia bacterium]